MLTVFSLKNPGRVDRVLSKNPVLTVFSQKIYKGSADLEEHLRARRSTVD